MAERTLEMTGPRGPKPRRRLSPTNIMLYGTLFVVEPLPRVVGPQTTCHLDASHIGIFHLGAFQFKVLLRDQMLSAGLIEEFLDRLRCLLGTLQSE